MASNFLGMFGPGPNPSAVLIQNGSLVAFIEEERLNRIKTSPNSLAIEAARACLKKGGVTIDEIDGIAYAWDSIRYVQEAGPFFDKARKEASDAGSFNKLQEDLLLNLYHHERIHHALQLGLGAQGEKLKLPPIRFYPHHLCHAASAFYCSGMDRAGILTLDGSGEETSTLLSVGGKDGIETLKRFQLPHTLGGFYATMTEYLGFKAYQDEGKLMGLASYGKYDQELQDKLDRVIPFDPKTGDFTVNPKMRYVGAHTTGARFTDEFTALFGPKRASGASALEGGWPDLAFAVQHRLEQIVIGLARQLYERTGLRKLCLAGGVAMNCVMNGKLAALDFVDDIFVQPAASDNGSALGAALLLAREKGVDASFKMTHLYYGNEYSNDEIRKALEESKIKFHHSDDVEKEIAQFLRDGKIVGWLQGPMEVGARALGGRSILGNPLIRNMKDKLNLEVKHRENWRPFCPSMKEEHYRKYIKASADSPFMIMAFPVQGQYREEIPAVVHVDGTARPQAVSKKDHPRFWKLLDEFEKLTGHGILINTSFNIQGEPIVCSPRDALRCFGGTGIDVLAMGDFIACKP